MKRFLLRETSNGFMQKLLEKDAAIMGGGDLVAPAQVVPDFLENRLSGKIVLSFQKFSGIIFCYILSLNCIVYDMFLGNSLPSSSYRLGVREANLHNLFIENLTELFKTAIVNFNKQVREAIFLNYCASLKVFLTSFHVCSFQASLIGVLFFMLLRCCFCYFNWFMFIECLVLAY